MQRDSCGSPRLRQRALESFSKRIGKLNVTRKHYIAHTKLKVMNAVTGFARSFLETLVNATELASCGHSRHAAAFIRQHRVTILGEKTRIRVRQNLPLKAKVIIVFDETSVTRNQITRRVRSQHSTSILNAVVATLEDGGHVHLGHGHVQETRVGKFQAVLTPRLVFRVDFLEDLVTIGQSIRQAVVVGVDTAVDQKMVFLEFNDNGTNLGGRSLNVRVRSVLCNGGTDVNAEIFAVVEQHQVAFAVERIATFLTPAQKVRVALSTIVVAAYSIGRVQRTSITSVRNSVSIRVDEIVSIWTNVHVIAN